MSDKYNIELKPSTPIGWYERGIFFYKKLKFILATPSAEELDGLGFDILEKIEELKNKSIACFEKAIQDWDKEAETHFIFTSYKEECKFLLQTEKGVIEEELIIKVSVKTKAHEKLSFSGIAPRRRLLQRTK